MIKIDRQLTQVYYEEALREGAQARADRKTQAGKPRNNTRGIYFLLAVIPVVFLLVRAFTAG